jgi:hypothetical protein
MDFPYIYRWDRHSRKGQFCRVLARGKMNSCCVEFEDGYKMITSRNALSRPFRPWDGAPRVLSSPQHVPLKLPAKS